MAGRIEAGEHRDDTVQGKISVSPLKVKKIVTLRT